MLASIVRTNLSATFATARVLSRAVMARNLSFAEKLRGKEHVEEDRFIRELDAKYFERKRAEMEEERAKEDVQHFHSKIAPAMYQAQCLLSETGDSVSEAALEALARWKVGF